MSSLNSNTPIVEIQHLGLIDYKKCWDYQTSLFDDTIARKISNRKVAPENQVPTKNYLLFCEHPHVYTLGKSGKENHLLINDDFLKNIDATYYKINRGGDITYHGPGQLVVYPIFDLEYFFTDIHRYLRTLEQAIINTLLEFGITAERYEGYTGVWLDADKPLVARKICAMGVKCSRWVTMHGLALNVNTDLNYFSHIVPCGIDDKKVTSIQKEGDKLIDMKSVSTLLIKELISLFDFTIV